MDDSIPQRYFSTGFLKARLSIRRVKWSFVDWQHVETVNQNRFVEVIIKQLYFFCQYHNLNNMKNRIELLPVLIAVISCLPLLVHAQNVGINTTTPNAVLDINGDLILRGSTLTLLNGENNNINTTGSKYSNYTITGPTTVFYITGINGGVDGRIVTLYNSTPFLMTLKHNALQSAANNTIHTGTGIDFVLSSYSSVTLRYMTFDSKWHINSSHNVWNPGGGGTNTSGWASSNDANGDPSYRATFPDNFDRLVFVNSPPMLGAGSGGYHSGGGLTVTNFVFPGDPTATLLTFDGSGIQGGLIDTHPGTRDTT